MAGKELLVKNGVFAVGDMAAKLTPEGLVITIRVGGGNYSVCLGENSMAFLCWLQHALFGVGETEIIYCKDPYGVGEGELIVKADDNTLVFFDSQYEDNSATSVRRFIEFFDEMLPLPEVKDTFKSYAHTIWTKAIEERKDWEESYGYTPEF